MHFAGEGRRLKTLEVEALAQPAEERDSLGLRAMEPAMSPPSRRLSKTTKAMSISARENFFD